MSWSARWFNGHDSTPHAAEVSLQGSELLIRLAGQGEGESPAWSTPASSLSVSERFAGAPRRLQLPDGSTLVVEEDAQGSFDQALQHQGHRPAVAVVLMRGWPAAIACLVVLLAFLVWMDRQGAGLLASRVTPLVPVSVDQRLAATMGTIIENNWLAPSQVPVERQELLYERVSELVNAQYPDLAWDLAFRNMRNSEDAFNALTLPDGTMVLLDGLTGSLTDEQVIAVVGHELGHVKYRHTMQRLLRQIGLLGLSAVVLGDVSGLAATATAGYQDLHYSRDAEREADAFAIDFLRRSGIPVERMAEAFDVMRAQETSGDLPGFLSSHPPTEERMRMARQAGKQQE
jgi:Zn-dependent protease with chaperone function